MHNAHMEQIEDDELVALLEQFKREGKIRTCGRRARAGDRLALRRHRSRAQARRPAMQMIWNMLEQFPGDAMVRAADEAGTRHRLLNPRAALEPGMLEGKYTAETTFAPTDHRSHRPRSWLINGIKKIETLRFLERPDRTLGQAAIQWLLAEPRVMSVLPNIYDREQLREFAAAADAPPLTRDELDRIAELARQNFGVPPEEGRYKGTMTPPPGLANAVHA